MSKTTRYHLPTGEAYDHLDSDPTALTRPCPACKAPIGNWCGGYGDIHDERMTAEELAARDKGSERGNI